MVTTDWDAFCGATISSGIKVAPAGGYPKPVMRVQNGGYGICQRMAKIQSQKAECVAVVAADATETNATVVSNISQKPLSYRPFGESNITSHARLANEYLETRAATEDDIACTAVKNYAAAAVTPWAHRREGYSTDAVLESVRLSTPLQELMTAPVSYGAVTTVAASESFVKARDLVPVWLTGAGIGSSRYGFTESESRLDQSGLAKAAATRTTVPVSTTRQRPSTPWKSVRPHPTTNCSPTRRWDSATARPPWNSFATVSRLTTVYSPSTLAAAHSRRTWVSVRGCLATPRSPCNS